MDSRQSEWRQTMRGLLPAARPLLGLFPIWGLQSLAGAVMHWFGIWKLPSYLQPAVLVAAILATVAVLWRARTGGPAAKDGLGMSQLLLPLLPVAVLAGAVLLLHEVQAVDPYFSDLFRGLILAFFYTLLGIMLGRHLVYLGLWLFALCAVTALYYLGFSPIVMQAYSGLSLLACGYILGVYARESGASPATSAERR